MLELHKKMLMQCVAQLRAIPGAHFKIIAPDGLEFGDLQVVKAEEKKKITRIRTGYDYAAVYMPHLQHLQPGDYAVVQVPKDCSSERMRGAITGWCTQTWGKGGTYTTSIEGDVVVVQRAVAVDEYPGAPTQGRLAAV